MSARDRLIEAATKVGNPHRLVNVRSGDILEALQDVPAAPVEEASRPASRSVKVDDLGLDEPTVAALRAAGLTTAAKIKAAGDLIALPDIGKVRAARIKAAVDNATAG